MFSALWKIFTFTSAITSEGLFHCQSYFFQVFTEEKENNSHLSASYKVPLRKPFTNQQAQPAPTPLNSNSQEAAGEGRQRADMGNKVEKKGKPGGKEGEEQVQKNWRPGSMHSQLRPSAQWDQVQEGTAARLGELLGTGWVRERQQQKVSPLSPSTSPAQHPHRW